MSAELKPCPFCGSRFKMSQEPHDNHPVAGMVYLYHDYGPLGSPARSCPLQFGGHFESEEAAVTAWNSRALLPAQTEPDVGRVEGWQPIETAPKDGTIVNVVGRYRDALSGYPRYAGFSQGMWREYSRFAPQPLICWAWRPRGEWPMEPTPPSPPREEIEHQGVVAVGVKG